MKAGAVVVVSLLLAAAEPARAGAPSVDCGAEAAALREGLTREAHRAHLWNTIWGITFSVSAVGSAAAGYYNFPKHELQAGLYVSAGKATIAALGRWVTPLSLSVPPATGDACADLDALHAAIKRNAKKEKVAFFLNHIGGIVLNVAGGFIVYHYSTVGQTALSVGGGYGIGLLATYTMPRESWHRYRDRDWDLPAAAPQPTLTVIPTQGGAFVSVGGAF
jgi:hypothetical protein